MAFRLGPMPPSLAAASLALFMERVAPHFSTAAKAQEAAKSS
jgi:hypothetical protein